MFVVCRVYGIDRKCPTTALLEKKSIHKDNKFPSRKYICTNIIEERFDYL